MLCYSYFDSCSVGLFFNVQIFFSVSFEWLLGCDFLDVIISGFYSFGSMLFVIGMLKRNIHHRHLAAFDLFAMQESLPLEVFDGKLFNFYLSTRILIAKSLELI